MSRILPKLFFNFALVSVFLFTSLSPVLAYTAPVPVIPPPDEDGKITMPAPKAGDGTLQGFQMSLALPEYNKESFDYQSFSGVMASTATMLYGCMLDTNNDGKIDREVCPKTIQTGAIPLMGGAIASVMSAPSASSINYLADLGGKLRLVQPAYAQTGFGFRAVDPFLPAWRAVRNFTYIFFVLAMVGFGIAIMVRTKISPQAVITIQSALPRVIVALILVTFSYAIVGFVVDLIYVVFGVLTWGLYTAGLTVYDPNNQWNEYVNAGFLQTVGFIMSRGIGGASDIVGGTALVSIPTIGAGIAGLIAAINALFGVAGAIATGAVSGTGLALAAIPMVIGLAIAVIVFLFRTLFALARAYLILLIHIIFAPIFILYGATIGPGIYGGWLRGVLANSLVFFFVGVLILATTFLMEIVGRAGAAWGPPYIGSNVNIIRGMISLGAVMLLPSIPEMVNQLLQIRTGFNVPLPQVQQQVQQLIGGTQQILSRFIVPNCMPGNSLISTPLGETAIANLKIGDVVWTINSGGERILSAIEFNIRKTVSQNHKMLNILLADGRNILASPNHPDPLGTPFSDFMAGDEFDNSLILKIELVSYKEGFIYDILPEGETGAYWANGILVGSTLLEKGKQNFTTPLL